MTYQVLPANRDWPQKAEQLAQQYVARLAGEDEEDRQLSEAALGLLLRGPVNMWTDTEIAETLLSSTFGLDWAALGELLEDNPAGLEYWEYNDQVAHMRGMAAASLAGGTPSVSLSDVIDELDATAANDLIDALTHACGVAR